MVNTMQVREIDTRRVSALVGLYVVVVVATLVALALLAAAGSSQATSDAWVHAAIVAFFAVLLPLRLRAARRGSRDAWRAVGVIGAVLVVANVVEAVLPGLFPGWMRVECLGIAVLMGVVVARVVRVRR
ncbi:hypothetical protein ACXR2U_08250 [Jatrophihabitans sp. YIM 134969]